MYVFQYFVMDETNETAPACSRPWNGFQRSSLGDWDKIGAFSIALRCDFH